MRTATFEISVQGEIDPEYAGLFAPSAVVPADGRTLITAVDVDQAALHGLLTRIVDLGLVLLEVRLVGDPPSGRRTL